jgi:hypothetical protein
MSKVVVKKTPIGFYEKDGLYFPRVTHVLSSLGKPGLDRWRGRIGNYEADRIATEAKDLGTAFHAVAADIGRGAHTQRGWSPPDHFRTMAFAYIDWLHRYVSDVLLVEHTTYNEEPRYGGTLDLLGRLRGDTALCIFDVKTSSQPSSDWPLQLSAYRKSMRAEGYDVDRRIIVRIPKKGECIPEMYEYKEHDRDEKIWEQVLEYWLWVQEDKKRQKDALTLCTP